MAKKGARNSRVCSTGPGRAAQAREGGARGNSASLKPGSEHRAGESFNSHFYNDTFSPWPANDVYDAPLAKWDYSDMQKQRLKEYEKLYGSTANQGWG